MDLGAFYAFSALVKFKADVFIAPDNEWSREEMSRARTEVVVPEEALAIRFSSPEDIILHKLLWYRMGGHESDQQWNDILGILRIPGNSLEFTYLERWAAFLDVSDLLSGARKDAASELHWGIIPGRLLLRNSLLLDFSLIFLDAV